MTNVGKVEGTLEKNSSTAEVEIAGVKWCLSREYSSLQIRGRLEENLLWTYTARGNLTVWGSNVERRFLVWSNSCDCYNALDDTFILELDIHTPGETVSFEGEIEVAKVRRIDLSSPTNEAIQSPEDAALLELSDKKIWVSKTILSVHSPFFKTLFSGDFKENATGTYALKEVDLHDFKFFLSIVYNLEITVDDGMIGKLAFINSSTLAEDPLESILRLGDMYQCEVVLRFCRDILRHLPDSFRLETKIEFCDRYGFWPLLTTIIKEAKPDELKALVKRGCCVQYSSFLRFLIENRLAASR
uniref:BTB domain-containing protein n=1 Tax=Steinernema glaseri TaxID=37863 RepID=A0A1I8AQW7_9BILA